MSDTSMVTFAQHMQVRHELQQAEYKAARLERELRDERNSNQIKVAEAIATRAVHTTFGDPYIPKRPLTVGGWAGACFDFLLRHPVTAEEKMDRAAIAYGSNDVASMQTDYGRALLGLKSIHKGGGDKPQAEPLYRLAEDMGDKWVYVYKIGESHHVARFPKDIRGLPAARQYVTFMNSLEA
ncbi:hypothetical protein [Xanthomonas phage SB1]|uniref:Uncharacterized protein n=1 Tax=Xanthomonas phage SB1 TaxID=3117471 RepID=A0ABZ2GY11_9CAUD